MNNQMPPENHQFKMIAIFIFCTVGVVLLYVIAITFIPIPKENQRFVDISLAFLLGWISANSSYLTGGSPQQTKKPPAIPDTSNTTQVADTIINSENKQANE
jgi:hypothetical protein